MPNTKPLWKTIIVIWSDKNPEKYELADLAQEATDGGMYCSKQRTVKVEDPKKDPDWDGSKFFDEDED